jgi:thiol-disulfide isomerase/thioredoxin
MKARFLVIAVAVVAGGPMFYEILNGDTIMAQQSKPAATAAPIEGRMPPFDGATGWLNSPALTREALRGKVVVVEFWTYTCINWLRTLAHVRAWAEKYKDRGLVVIGVHSPEFSFERDVDNVRSATKAMKILYPVAIDSDFAIWNAFGNAYWPALYFIDAQGRIRHHRFGEGDYEESERIIQRLLEETRASGTGNPTFAVEARGPEVEADWGDLVSPETYVGLERGERFDSPAPTAKDGGQLYAFPARLRPSHWAISGDWMVGKEAIVSNRASDRIAYRFHARDLHLVMGPAARGKTVRFRVRLDGLPPADAHGGDVDDQGNGTLREQRLYQLIRQPKPIVDRLFEIEFLDPGAAAFAFTFG